MEIKVSDVQGMLAKGKTREEIREHYELSKKELKHLFQHPKLKGLKTKKPFSPSFDLVDDTEENNDSPQDSYRPEYGNTSESEH